MTGDYSLGIAFRLFANWYALPNDEARSIERQHGHPVPYTEGIEVQRMERDVVWLWARYVDAGPFNPQ